MLRIIFITLFLIINISPAISAIKGESSFDSGVKYFKQKKYNSALRLFKKANSAGMKSDVLTYNLGVTHYKLGHYKSSKKYFHRLTKNKKFRQIAYYNLGLISEKNGNKKTAINFFKKSAKINNNKISILANNKLDTILKRKKTTNNLKTDLHIAFGNDDNITNATSNSPSNKSSTYLELFATIKSPVNNKMDVKGTVFSINYNDKPTEDFMFYSAALNYKANAKKWDVIPEASFLQSNLNKINYQRVMDLKLTGKRILRNKARISLRYRFSDIRSQNTLYNYLQGTRHQFRADYKSKLNFGGMRLRYQIENNDRDNSATSNYSPTRHTLRVRLKQKLNNMSFSEEIGYRVSQYGEASGISRNDKRLRLNFSLSKKISKDLLSGIQYNHTKNNSNISSENYSRNNIQIFAQWGF